MGYGTIRDTDQERLVYTRLDYLEKDGLHPFSFTRNGTFGRTERGGSQLRLPHEVPRSDTTLLRPYQNCLYHSVRLYLTNSTSVFKHECLRSSSSVSYGPFRYGPSRCLESSNLSATRTGSGDDPKNVPPCPLRPIHTTDSCES